MLRTRAASSVFVVLVAIVPALFGPGPAAVAFGALGLLALHELAAMLAKAGYPVVWPLAAVVIVGGVVAATTPVFASVFVLLVALAVLLPGGWLLFRPTLDGTLPTWLGTTFAALFIAVPLAHAVALRALPGGVAVGSAWFTGLLATLDLSRAFGSAHTDTARGMAWLLFSLITVWFTDVGAYAVGRIAGRRSLIPHVSPKKTWEGFWGGLVGGTVVAAVSNFSFGIGLPWFVAIGIGAVIAVVAAVGDLAESLLKRQAGVKDSGQLIPGHGGILDRTDSQLYAFVAVYYLALLFG